MHTVSLMSSLLARLGGSNRHSGQPLPSRPIQPGPKRFLIDDLPLGAGGIGFVVKFTNCRLFVRGSIVKEDLWVRDGRVIDPASRFWEAASFSEFACDLIVDCGNKLLSPGFIDLQLNGGYGIDFSKPDVTSEEIHYVCERLLETGCTSICPTLVSSSIETYNTVLKTFKKLQDHFDDISSLIQSKGVAVYPLGDMSPLISRPGARIIGLHLEGPFINKERKGAHNMANLREPTPAVPVDFVEPTDPPSSSTNVLTRKSGLPALERVYGPLDWKSGFVRVVTLAPELGGALDAISALSRCGIVASIGHTSSLIKTADAAVINGASLITHLFNAMSAFHHRDPGVIGLLGRLPGGVGISSMKSRDLKKSAFQNYRDLDSQRSNHINSLLQGQTEQSLISVTSDQCSQSLARSTPHQISDAHCSSHSCSDSECTACMFAEAVDNPELDGANASCSDESIGDESPSLNPLSEAVAALSKVESVTAFSKVPFRRFRNRRRRISRQSGYRGQYQSRNNNRKKQNGVQVMHYNQYLNTDPKLPSEFNHLSGNSPGSAPHFQLINGIPAPLPVAGGSATPTASVNVDDSNKNSPAHDNFPDNSLNPPSSHMVSRSISFSLPPIGTIMHEYESVTSIQGALVSQDPVIPSTPIYPSPSPNVIGYTNSTMPVGATVAIVSDNANNNLFSTTNPIVTSDVDIANHSQKNCSSTSEKNTIIEHKSVKSSASETSFHSKGLTRVHERPFYSLIVDGVHCHPYAVNIAYETHPHGLILITDAMEALGLPIGKHSLGDMDVDIFMGLEDGHYEGRHAVLAGTDTLAGAVATLDECLRNLLAFTLCPVEIGLATVTSHPASALRLHGILGSLNTGAWADIVVLDDDFNVVQTWVSGQLLYKKSIGQVAYLN